MTTDPHGFKPGTNYNRRHASFPVTGLDDLAVRLHVAQAIVAMDCDAGRHRPETAETGDEVCKFCGTVTDDYADVAAYRAAKDEPGAAA